MKTQIIKYGIVAALIIALFASIRQCNHVQQERNRLDNNQNVLLSDIERYKVRDSLNAVSVGVLTMKVDEFGRYFSDMEAMIKDMGVKLRRVESISQTALESSYHLQATARDTTVVIVQPDSTKQEVPAQVIKYEDPHISFHGMIADQQFYGDIKTQDTLFQIIHRVPRKFLFFRWGTKEFRQEVVSSNPYSNITYNRVLKIEK